MTTPRAAVQSLLETDAGLLSLGVTSVFGSNAADSVTDDLFVVIHWEEGSRVFGNRGVDSVLIWVHDKNRDYGRIDQALRRIRDVLQEAVHVPGVDGVTLTQADWQGWSGDLYDDGYNTVTRNGGFAVVAR